MSRQKLVELIVRIIIGIILVGISDILLHGAEDLVRTFCYALYFSLIINIVFYFLDQRSKK